MPRGGDRRPIQQPEGRDLHYAALLMHAMCIDESEAGVRFNQERIALFRKWERLVRCLNRYQLRGWGEPMKRVASRKVPVMLLTRLATSASASRPS